ncbi:molybdenum cofactor guanylyltransferase MobA [Sulfurivermis fontis]|uniref:molybdenum cofactor guanylyltransferase MobA n=1 Tax=Sulfurivermis fontis TaxID=1972068 RepID=UPI000FD9F6EF|nr:molybdenum cofactor guanylyltransferase MobA [Sulfurivermis fontis]
MPVQTALPAITAVILAGGRARRMAGADKALLPLAGRPLLAHVIAALRPQVDMILLNSNRAAAAYASFGLPVIADTLPDQPGPLAGLLAALQASTSDLVLCVPCDTPCLPAALVQRMYTALSQAAADVCTVSDGERLHAAIMLAHRRVQPALESYLISGGRKVQDWLHSQKLVVADFSDQSAAFSNINTAQDLQALEQRFSAHEC